MNQILEFAEEIGIHEFVKEIKEVSLPEDVNLQELFIKRFYKLLLDYTYECLPILNEFELEKHNQKIDQFKQLG